MDIVLHIQRKIQLWILNYLLFDLQNKEFHKLDLQVLLKEYLINQEYLREFVDQYVFLFICKENHLCEIIIFIIYAKSFIGISFLSLHKRRISKCYNI